uniref:Cytochrome c oxidase subunit 3 n=1 Tax=Oncicola luehei TaxID=1100885 RepID=H2E2E4_9BILA|nr:cytochrome c oxidase subunit III [Oncicola luehei]AER42903.1 cytochrome c oxidase subunit 3 [Oncicola luehei]
MWSMSPGYMVVGSVWPMILSISVLNLVLTLVSCGLPASVLVGLPLVVLSIIGWIGDTLFEASVLGYGGSKDGVSVSFGVLLVIVSEVMLFFGLLWFLLQVSLEGVVGLGYEWHSGMMSSVDIMEMPLLISVVLLSSGVSVTWAHSSISCGDKWGYVVGYFMTVVLGVLFLSIQYFEYGGLGMSIEEGVFPSVFFVLTSLHGLHVLAGVLMNMLSLWSSLSWGVPVSFMGVEVVMWYWHFIDVVWLVLFILLYWFSM